MKNTDVRTHYMHLNIDPFNKIKNGSKKIEIRILDEKRKSIHIGDHILFSLINDPTEKINTLVTEIFTAKSFEELFKMLPSENQGNFQVEDMYKYYSKQEEKMNGVIGIGIKCVPDPGL